ncbi:NAD(P)/FAD-dependent oxidoreductase [Microbacterium gilvum]|uniref:NAD(P)/FAD-dependent oxidoreductase n=1 Tax=Microbacterium gilvum TaxID=1336204 RepID=A0ABP9A1R6_9MICO
MHDVAIIGGGPAGLQAALTLGRMHRTVALVDSGAYRNDPTSALHNLIAHDGQAPADLRAAARRNLDAYATVEVIGARVARISGELGAFSLALDDGRVVEAGRLVLATGVADALPAVPGLAELFGDLVAHCPFCHGHEFAGRRVGIVGAGDHGQRLAAMLAPIASEVVILPGDGEASEATTSVRPGRIERMAQADDGVEVRFADGTREEFAGLFTATVWRQAAPFAAELGLEVSEVGGVRVDAFGRTSRPGVYAAGDIAQPAGMPGPMHAVAAAIASGQLAGVACVQDLVAEALAS